MQNLLGLTAFIRALGERQAGFSALYLVPDGDDYASTANKLIAISGREKVKISTSQAFIVDASSLQTNLAVKILRK